MNESNASSIDLSPIQDRDMFSGIFENLPVITLILISTLLIDVVYVGLSLGIIWYERFGQDHRRTLMNKLVVSIFWTALIAVPIIQMSEIPRYFFGPMPVNFCFFQSVVKNSIRWQCLLLLDAVILSRYIFIFWLKNPAAVNDGFWAIVINLGTAGISLICNYIIFYLPGSLIYLINCTRSVLKSFT